MPRIGRYEIRSELGRGGFARVYRGFDRTMGREVAIKELTLLDEPSAMSRFLAEARTVGNLRHKNIVTIHESGEHEGRPYIVMELLEGETLQELIQRGAGLSLLERLRILQQVAEGLAFAHQRGIIHRDIKPANIMRLPNGDAKILDFGIARALGTGDTRRTTPGYFIGTIAYSAPERLSDVDADAIADVFSYGVLAYELLCGQHPFKAADSRMLICNIATRDPQYSLAELVPNCPPALDELTQRALKKQRESRFQSMEEVVLDLKPIVLELEHEEAERLTLRVEPLVRHGRIAEAEELLRKVRELDPSNRKARRLHEAIQQEQRQALLRNRVNALVQEADAKLSERRFVEAIQLLESASNLLPDNDVNARLEQARAAQDANRRAARFVSDAQRQVEEGNYDEALRLIGSALAIDSKDPTACELYGQLREFVRGIEAVRALRLGSEFDRALEALSALPPAYAESNAVLKLWHEIEADRDFQRRAGEIRGLIEAGLLKQARSIIEGLPRDFASRPEIAALWESLNTSEDARHRSDDIQKRTDAARGLLKAGRFAEACRALEDAHDRFPEDSAVSSLLHDARARRAADDRARFVAATLETARRLYRTGNLKDALRTIALALPDCGDNLEILALKRHLEAEYERQQSQAAASHVSQLLAAGRVDEATFEIERILRRQPNNAELQALLARSLTIRQEQEFCAQVKSRVQELESAGGLQSAYECVAQGLQSYPANSELRDIESRLSRALREVAAAWSDAPTLTFPTKKTVKSEGKSRLGLYSGLSLSAAAALVCIGFFALRGHQTVADVIQKRPDLPANPVTQPSAPVPAPRLSQTRLSPPMDASHPAQIQRSAGPPPQAKTPPPAAAVDPEQNAWSRVQNAVDAGSLRAFLAAYPAGVHATQARDRLAQLEWAAVDQQNPAALESYARQYPANPHTTEALAQLHHLRENERSLAEQAEQQAILGTLAKFSGAIERKDLAQLRELWPGIPASKLADWSSIFKSTRSTRIELHPKLTPRVNAGTATVECVSTTQKIFAGDAQVYTTEEIAHFTLRKQGANWIIESMR